jgi:hypothetical protein
VQYVAFHSCLNITTDDSALLPLFPHITLTIPDGIVFIHLLPTYKELVWIFLYEDGNGRHGYDRRGLDRSMSES